jgi:hypothetical protein|tara:strand:- start:469 stop:771 length:303 start_codon:yes stop_codon:yes gene_type:complete
MSKRKMPAKWTPEHTIVLQEGIANGRALATIAKKLKVSYSTIYRKYRMINSKSPKISNTVGRPRKTFNTSNTTRTITGNVSIIHDAFTITTQGKSITIKL